MSRPPDMPERDPALERAWREHSHESPPPALDRTILAAAHRAVGARPEVAQAPEATSPQRWWMPLAAAATIGAVALGILQTMPTDTGLGLPESAPPTLPQRPAEKLAADAPASAPAVKEETARDAQSAPTTAEKKKQAAAPAPSLPTRAAPPAAARAEPPPIAAGKAATAAAAQRENPIAKREAPPAPPAPTVAAAPAPPPAPMQRAPAAQAASQDEAHGNLARAPEPFPAAPAPRKDDRGAAAGGRTVADALDPASRATPAATAEADARQDASSKRQKAFDAAAAPPVAASSIGRLQQAPPAAPARAGTTRAREEMREAAPKPLAKTTAAAADAQLKARDPDAWIVRIRKLRDEGHTADALRELREFREAVPDAERRLPADLRDWAAAVRP